MKKLNKSNKLHDVVIINDDKSQTKMKFYDALQEAESKGLDLVQMNTTNNPAVCKFMNYGKMMYDLSKKDKQNKSQEVLLKEVQLSPRISDHDLIHKIKSINSFLEKKNKVKVIMFFKGRMSTHKDVGMSIMKKVQAQVKGTIEKQQEEAKNISIIFTF